ncbi:MAG: anthranilate synthase component I family protein [Bacteroidetes bacterium]|nr:anthranilate synthase component I family protein [Bacteroidota bacterium]
MFTQKITPNNTYLIPFESEDIIEAEPIFLKESETVSTLKKIHCRTNKDTYLKQVHHLLKHIQKGDIYEINYCVEFYAENVDINPYTVFKHLKKYTEAPFAQTVRVGNTLVMCASPERFIQKKGNKLFTQPMKGTARRSANEDEDQQIKQTLKNNKKEQSENVMAVDVARNDLSHIAAKGSVRVEELFGVYTFKNVHQMISTVSCILKKDTNISSILQATFPPASMTGAPKTKALELIKKHETTARGMYSGILGTIQENGDFDFCVLIRTILYNGKKKQLSFHVGGAITAQCKPEDEWDECLLKAETLLKALGLTQQDIIFAP